MSSNGMKIKLATALTALIILGGGVAYIHTSFAKADDVKDIRESQIEIGKDVSAMKADIDNIKSAQKEIRTDQRQIRRDTQKILDAVTR